MRDGSARRSSAPPPGAASAPTRAAVRLGDLAHDRQAEAGAGPPARRRRRGRSGRRRAGRSSSADAGAVVAHRQLAVAQSHLDRARPAGSTWPRCRAGWRPRGRAARATPRDQRARARPRSAIAGAWRRARSTAAATSSSRRTSSALGVALLVARELDEVADQRGQLLELARTRSAAGARGRPRRRAAARQHLEVGAQRGQRRAQLVRRVGDELALRALRALERLEHRVERAREAGELVVALGARCGGDRSRVRGDVLGGRGELGDRAAARRARDGRERRPDGDAGQPIDEPRARSAQPAERARRPRSAAARRHDRAGAGRAW